MKRVLKPDKPKGDEDLNQYLKNKKKRVEILKKVLFKLKKIKN